MNGIRTLAALAVLTVLLGATSARAQDTDRAAVALQRAIRVELVDGDLQAAIALYEEIAEQFSAERAVAATALRHLGECYEKLGEPEARIAYERVLREYADQAEPVAAVRARLAALEVEATQPSPALNTELLWADARGVDARGDVSPDGSLVTYTDWSDLGNLAIRNLATGESRRLTRTADNGSGSNGGNYAGSSRISPDGEQVLYDWARSSPVGETGELRLVPVHGDQTEPRIVWSPADGSYAGVQDWFPSGGRVVAVVNAHDHFSIVTVSTVDGQVRQVHSFDWGRFPQVRVSPDGRHLAYSRSASREVPEMDIFLVAADGSSGDIPLVQHAANDELVAWSQDGTYLLFNSDRSGRPGLWAQRVHDATPAGEPQLLIANLDVGAGLGVTRDGALHYPVRVTRRRMKIAELDMKTGKLLSQPANVTDQFVGGNGGGAFSPDGERLAYVSSRLRGGKRAIVIRSLETGEERVVPHELERVQRLAWQFDNDHLAVTGSSNRVEYGHFDVDAATGVTRPLTEDVTEMLKPIVTPDGTQILYRIRGDWETLYSYRVADGSVRALPGVSAGNFSLSPDGQWIATVFRSENTEIDTPSFTGSAAINTEIRLHPAVGGDGELLWTTDASERFGRWTTWTPDSTALLVLKEEPQAGEHMWRLWVVPVDRSDPVATELVYALEGAPARVRIHPDGKRIVYDDAGGGSVTQFWAVRNLGLE